MAGDKIVREDVTETELFRIPTKFIESHRFFFGEKIPIGSNRRKKFRAINLVWNWQKNKTKRFPKIFAGRKNRNLVFQELDLVPDLG